MSDQQFNAQVEQVAGRDIINMGVGHDRPRTLSDAPSEQLRAMHSDSLRQRHSALKALVFNVPNLVLIAAIAVAMWNAITSFQTLGSGVAPNYPPWLPTAFVVAVFMYHSISTSKRVRDLRSITARLNTIERILRSRID